MCIQMFVIHSVLDEPVYLVLLWQNGELVCLHAVFDEVMPNEYFLSYRKL